MRLDQGSIESAARAVADRSGGELAELVNNAGTGIPKPLEILVPI